MLKQYMHKVTVSQKRSPTYFCSVLVKYEPISIRTGWHVKKEILDKTTQKFFTSSKICASTSLGKLKSQIEPLTQYMHVHFNESMNSHKHHRQLLSQKL